ILSTHEWRSQKQNPAPQNGTGAAPQNGTGEPNFPHLKTRLKPDSPHLKTELLSRSQGWTGGGSRDGETTSVSPEYPPLSPREEAAVPPPTFQPLTAGSSVVDAFRLPPGPRWRLVGDNPEGTAMVFIKEI